MSKSTYERADDLHEDANQTDFRDASAVRDVVTNMARVVRAMAAEIESLKRKCNDES